MRTDYIRTALKVAQTGNFCKAGEALFMTHQAVTHRVRVLEKELGFLLFHCPNGYIKGGVVPTDQGAKWLTFARKAVELLDAGTVEIKRAERVTKGRGTL